MKINRISRNKVNQIAQAGHWGSANTAMYFQYLKMSAMNINPKDGSQIMQMAPNGKMHTWTVKNGELVF